MKAARFYDRGDIRIEDIPEPVVAPGTVGVQVAWSGICGSDLHEFMEGPIFIPLGAIRIRFQANTRPSPWGMNSQAWCMQWGRA